jgi:hypothetical protein
MFKDEKMKARMEEVNVKAKRKLINPRVTEASRQMIARDDSRLDLLELPPVMGNPMETLKQRRDKRLCAQLGMKRDFSKWEEDSWTFPEV